MSSEPNDFAYQEQMFGKDGPTTCQLKEAYSRAHDIRKFEIELYWKRSAYLWAMQAAVLAGVGFFIQSGGTLSDGDCAGWANSSCREQYFNFAVLTAFMVFGLVSSYAWLLVVKGGKFWQNNWERHVDALENEISGALYKTYLVERKKSPPPYSVSKANELMAFAAIIIWIGLGGVLVVLFWSTVVSYIVYVSIISVGLFLVSYFDDCLRMNSFPVSEKASWGSGNQEYFVYRRPDPVNVKSINKEND